MNYKIYLSNIKKLRKKVQTAIRTGSYKHYKKFNEEIYLFIKKFHMRRADKKVNARIIMHPETKDKMNHFSNLKYYKYK
jgi:hypothetical protein